MSPVALESPSRAVWKVKHHGLAALGVRISVKGDRFLVNCSYALSLTVNGFLGFLTVGRTNALNLVTYLILNLPPVHERLPSPLTVLVGNMKYPHPRPRFSLQAAISSGQHAKIRYQHAHHSA